MRLSERLQGLIDLHVLYAMAICFLLTLPVKNLALFAFVFGMAFLFYVGQMAFCDRRHRTAGRILVNLVVVVVPFWLEWLIRW